MVPDSALEATQASLFACSSAPSRQPMKRFAGGANTSSSPLIATEAYESTSIFDRVETADTRARKRAAVEVSYGPLRTPSATRSPSSVAPSEVWVG